MSAAFDVRYTAQLARLNLSDEEIAKFQTQLSMQRMADLISFYHAQLWINHEMEQTKKQKHSPEYYE